MIRPRLLSAFLLISAPATAQTAFAGLASTQPTTGPHLQEFTSEKFRVRFQYPADWQLPANPLPGQVFSAQLPTPSAIAAITLRMDTTPLADDRAALADLSDSLAAYVFNNGGKKVTIHPDQLGDLPARRIHFFSDTPSATIQTLYIVAVKNRRAYVWNFVADN